MLGKFESVEVVNRQKMVAVTLNSPEKRNSINPVLVKDLNHVLTQAEENHDCRVLVLRAEGQTFCAGLDFEMVTHSSELVESDIRTQGEAFYRLMSRMVESRIVIIAAVDGKVSAGGMGLASAADFIISTPISQYVLPEALWGLVPCCVAPFVIRRMGGQKTKNMALSAKNLSAEEALRLNLVDEVTENLELSLRVLTNRLCQLDTATLYKTKTFFNQLAEASSIDERYILDQYAEVMSYPKVKENIIRFTTEGKFPWEQ